MTKLFPDPSDLSALDVAALSSLIRDRKLSPVEVTRHALDRIHALQDTLNAFITICEETAMAEARQAEVEIGRGDYRGILHGIPYSAKDLIATAGIRTTMGARFESATVPSVDAVPIARLKNAGAILLGKTTTPAFGHKPDTEGKLFGQTLNPYDAALTCGGSSGGAAVAIVSGQGPLALGTDGGGSVRIPAACCGAVGLKATLGVIPHVQLPDLFAANSYIGPMARNVDDTRILFDVIAGPDRNDPFGQHDLTLAAEEALPGLRIGVLAHVGNKQVDPQCRAALDRAVTYLQEGGAVVREAEIDFAALEDAFLIILQSALWARLSDAYGARPEDFDPSLATTIEYGRHLTAADLHGANLQRSIAFKKVQQLFERFDLLISPTLACPPLAAGLDPHENVAINGHDAGRIRAAWYPYTFPFNLTGHPALALPCGETDQTGLPLSVQIIGPWYSDRQLLSVGAEIEKRNGLYRA